MMERFESLAVYHKALTFTKAAHSTVRLFPKDELFGLTSQLRRAADSIVLNIAEGSGNSSRREVCKFLDYSIRSGFECVACLDIALQIKYIDQVERDDKVHQVKEITAMLYGLKKALQR